MDREMKIVPEIAKSLPPVGVAGATLFGITVQDWVLILTGLYLCMQMVVILPKVWYTIKSRRDGTPPVTKE